MEMETRHARQENNFTVASRSQIAYTGFNRVRTFTFMKTKWQLAGLAFAALLYAGCVVQSINPLFTEKDYIPYPGLIGTWVQQEDAKIVGTWTFTADGARYEFTQTDEKGRKAAFIAAAGKIGPHTFLEASPRDPLPGGALNDLMTLHLIPAHVFVKAVKTNDALLLLSMDLDWLTRHLEANPKALAHVIRDKVPVLTASTEELKKFVAKHADDPAVFKNEIRLVPKRPGN
jgi:hypothetical protein